MIINTNPMSISYYMNSKNRIKNWKMKYQSRINNIARNLIMSRNI